MKHCYTDCVIKSDDTYRTRYDCVICHKQFYQLKQRVEGVSTNNTNDSSMFLINGSPFITCGWCTQPEKLHDSHKIRIFIKWEEIDQVVAYTSDGVRYIKQRYRPKLITKPGCRECYHIQQCETLKYKRPHAFNMVMKALVETALPVDSTKYSTPVEYDIVWDGIGYLTTKHETLLYGSVYGPYSDRKGTR